MKQSLIEQPGTLLDEVQSRGLDVLSNGYPYMIERDAVVDKSSANDMSATFTVVTRRKEPNRNGHTVQIVGDKHGQGIRLDNFAKNPVVLFDHGMSGLALPIGIAESPDGKLSFTKQKTKATSTVWFSQRLPEAAQIFALVDEGILRTSSISFLPLKGLLNEYDTPKQKKTDDGREVYDMSTPYYSFDFIEADLLEWSVVGIPADADAVRKHLDRGNICGEKITQSLRPVLQGMAGDPKVWSPGWVRSDSASAAPVEDEATVDAVDPVADETAEEDLMHQLVEAQRQILEDLRRIGDRLAAAEDNPEPVERDAADVTADAAATEAEIERIVAGAVEQSLAGLKGDLDASRAARVLELLD